jgi:hypothetical protein
MTYLHVHLESQHPVRTHMCKHTCPFYSDKMWKTQEWTCFFSLESQTTVLRPGHWQKYGHIADALCTRRMREFLIDRGRAGTATQTSTLSSRYIHGTASS